MLVGLFPHLFSSLSLDHWLLCSLFPESSPVHSQDGPVPSSRPVFCWDHLLLVSILIPSSFSLNNLIWELYLTHPNVPTTLNSVSPKINILEHHDWHGTVGSWEFGPWDTGQSALSLQASLLSSFLFLFFPSKIYWDAYFYIESPTRKAQISAQSHKPGVWQLGLSHLNNLVANIQNAKKKKTLH